MRARLALYVAKIPFEHREIVLRDKPESMLKISPKGTVPVLQLVDGRVVDESFDVMAWALRESEHSMWNDFEKSIPLVKMNDTVFKPQLDRFKYPTRFLEEGDERMVRDNALLKANDFLQTLEDALAGYENLLGDGLSVADLAIFPFVRQFSKVDDDMWSKNNYPHVRGWLAKHLESDLFKSVMQKYAPWQEGNPPLFMHVDK